MGTKEIVCNHCNKQIKGKMRIVGLMIVCPYCQRPAENVAMGVECGAEMTILPLYSAKEVKRK